mmetsp:Transcript_7639/g.23602  ORF Transcript_7639/g.23602 Transcript_7639/m.23602 type:complete len:132 (-) Transcript_7639:1279-1674(-)
MHSQESMPPAHVGCDKAEDARAPAVPLESSLSCSVVTLGCADVDTVAVRVVTPDLDTLDRTVIADDRNRPSRLDDDHESFGRELMRSCYLAGDDGLAFPEPLYPPKAQKPTKVRRSRRLHGSLLRPALSRS